jgi:hypothetical protein
MIFREADLPLIDAFLLRESNQFPGSEVARRMYRLRMKDTLFAYDGEGDPAFDHIHIQSLTNLGLVDSELVLSSVQYQSYRDVEFYLPPSLNGSMAIHIKEVL